jgi:drug/metabolite transporter (DMT)-like permease
MIQKSSITLTISIISVSLAAILIKTVSKETSPITISFYRMLFTTLLIFLIVLLKKKYQQQILLLTKKQILVMSIIGVVLAIHFVLWITSLDLTSVASSVLLVTAHPILVGPISHYFLKEKLSFINSIGIIISFCGIIILVYGNSGLINSSIDTVEGNILAFLGGIAAGLYILGGRYTRNKIAVIPYVFVVYSVATIVLFFFSLIFESTLINVPIRDLEIILLMAGISGILGHTLYNWSLEHIKASVASVALLGEPIGSAFFAAVLPWIHEIPTRYTLFGGCIILTGIYLTAMNKQKKDKIL